MLGINGDIIIGMILVTLACLVATTNAAGDNPTVPFTPQSEWPRNTSFFFPHECPTAERTCCPTFDGEICGGFRGKCYNVMADDTVCDITHHRIGLWWFSDFFDFACVCASGFGGINCAHCLPGFAGTYCNETQLPLVRRDFGSMSPDDQQRIINAFAALRDMPTPYRPDIPMYTTFVAMHVWAMTGVPQTNHPELAGFDLGYGHGGPAAPTWHRAFSRLIEHALQEVLGDRTFALPYWDWSRSKGNNLDAALRMLGGDGDPTSFENCRVRISTTSGCNCTVTRGPWAGVPVLGVWGKDLGWTLQRAFGCMESSLPTSDVVDHIANLTYYNSTIYESFRPMVGGLTERPRWPFSWPPSVDGIDMHARVHKWLGGTMMGNYAPNDPIFFMLHGYVDLQFERFLRNGIARGTYGPSNALPVTGAPIGHNLYECIGPMFPLHSHADFFRDSRELGYTYDYFLNGPGDDGVTPITNTFPHTWAEAQLEAEEDSSIYNEMIAMADRLHRAQQAAKTGEKATDHRTAAAASTSSKKKTSSSSSKKNVKRSRATTTAQGTL